MADGGERRGARKRRRRSRGGGGEAGGLRAALLYLHLSCLFGVLKLGFSMELWGRREEGGHTSTYYPQCQAWSQHIDPALLQAHSDAIAEARVKTYEQLVLRFLARFLVDEEREVPSIPPPHTHPTPPTHPDPRPPCA